MKEGGKEGRSARRRRPRARRRVSTTSVRAEGRLIARGRRPRARASRLRPRRQSRQKEEVQWHEIDIV